MRVSNDWHRACVSKEHREANVMNRDSTMLALVCEVARYARSPQEIVDRVASLVNSGRVRLNGNFSNVRFTEDWAEPVPESSARRGRR